MSYQIKQINLFVFSISACLSTIFVVQQAIAQGLPTELMELSIEDINSVEIGSELSAKKPIANQAKSVRVDNSKWHFAYDYRRIRFEGYRDGKTELSNDEVLWTPGEEERTEDNFPVLPNIIIQELHLVKLAYDITYQSTVSVFIPYVKQSTDHISSVPGFE